MEIPETSLLAAAIAKSGPEIKNHCSAIASASRMARLQQVFAATLLRPILIFFAAKKNGLPTAAVAARLLQLKDISYICPERTDI